MTYDLSIVVPIDFSRRSREIYQRTIRMAKMLQGTNITLVLGCAAEPQRWINKLSKELKKYPKVQMVSAPQCQSHLAKLRNIALAEVITKYVLFLDVDIFPDLAQIQYAYHEVIASPTQVCMYPCLYLSKAGSRKLGRIPSAAFQQYYYQFKRNLILHLAFPSSIVISDLDSIRAIGGFDDQYVGHGYEDFDFMIRLFIHKGLFKASTKLCIDEPYMAPMMAVGFRAEMAKVHLQQLTGTNYFVHDYHTKDKNENYYQQRKMNKVKFDTKINLLIGESITTHTPLELLNCFHKHLITHNKKPSEFAALWAEIPGHMFR